MRGGGPGADEDVGGVGEFGAGQEPGDEDAEKSGGIDKVPVFEEAQVDFDFLVVVMMDQAVRRTVRNRFVIRRRMGVKIGMGGDFNHEEFFAQIGNDGIAKSGDSDGAEVADQQYDPEFCFSAMELEEGGGDHGTEDHMGGVEDQEKGMAMGLTEVFKDEHKGNAEDGAEHGEGHMLFQFEVHMFDSAGWGHFVLFLSQYK